MQTIRPLMAVRWAAIAWVVVFWRLGYPSLLDPDEAHYAQITREMLQSGNWMVPVLDGKPYIDKPIFFHWLQGLSMTILGETEFAARLPSALAAIALIAIVWWLGARLFDRETGEAGAAMFATVPFTFALASIGQFDMVYTAFLFGGLACLLDSTLERRTWLEYPGYVLVALAVMTKGPVALLLVAVAFAAALGFSRRTREAVLRLHWVRGFAITVVVSSPWFLWMSWQFGEDFIRPYFLAGNVWYFTNPEAFSSRQMSHTFYLRIFIAAFFPWSLLVVGRLIDAVRAWRRESPPTEELFLWLWTLTVIVFFSAARFKLDHYIFPAAPACALLAGRAWRLTAADGRARWTRISIRAVAVSFVVMGAVGSVARVRINLGLGTTALALPIALVAGGLLLVAQLAARSWRPAAALAVTVGTLLAVYVTVDAIGLTVLERSRPTAPLARWVIGHTGPTTPVGVYRTHDWRASIRYYANRPVTPLETPADLRKFLAASPPDAYVLMVNRDYDILRARGFEVEKVIERPAIVGRTGKYFRRQIWGQLIVAKRRSPTG
jgi:4-amino-4-deoxy-L-arabinose transferase-like glycosyltransferase